MFYHNPSVCQVRLIFVFQSKIVSHFSLFTLMYHTFLFLSVREDEYDSDSEESTDVIRNKYDSGEYIDLLQLLLNHKDTDSGTLLHYATRVSVSTVENIAECQNDTLVSNLDS